MSNKRDPSTDNDDWISEMQEMKKHIEIQGHCKHADHLATQVRELDEVIIDINKNIETSEQIFATMGKDLEENDDAYPDID